MGPRQRKKGNKNNETSSAPDPQAQHAVAIKKMQQGKLNRNKKKQMSKLYFYASVVAGVAVFGWLFLYAANLGSDMIWMDAATRTFLKSFVCDDPEGGYCHANLVPTRRTQKAKKLIPVGERILTVPRHLTIFDLDALRDDFVKTELASARHVHSHNPLHSGAFLAAYLARRVYAYNETEQEEEDPMRPYFDILPTFQTLEPFHPALWSEKRLNGLFEPHSWTFTIVRGHQDMLRSEYAAFSNASPTFAEQVTEEQYKTMRVNVLSRSFGAGPPAQDEALSNVSLQEELNQYKETMGVDLSKGCHAMVPVLDMYDHHPRPNVGWEYDTDERAFVIDSIRPIPPGQEVMDSYGKYSDAHLFAKFGFVNGDGSGHVEASVAALHRPLDIGMKELFSYVPFSGDLEKGLVEHQKDLLAHYLVFDDGYDDCIEKELHPESFAFKQLKLQHLSRIANQPKKWLLTMPPRTETSRPAKSTDMPITFSPPGFNVENIDLGAGKLIETCRLIALAEYDYNGNATAVLKEALDTNNETFVVENQGSDLEFRALACLARLSGIGRWRYKQDVQDEMKLVKELTYDAFQSRHWNAAQLRLGEMQALEVLHRVAISGVMEMTNRIEEETGSRDNVPFVREQPCPAEFTKALLVKNDGVAV